MTDRPVPFTPEEIAELREIDHGLMGSRWSSDQCSRLISIAEDHAALTDAVEYEQTLRRSYARQADVADDACKSMRAEIDDLHTKDTRRTAEHNLLVKENRELRAEVERLKDELHRFHADPCCDLAAANARIAHLESDLADARGEPCAVTRVHTNKEI